MGALEQDLIKELGDKLSTCEEGYYKVKANYKQYAEFVRLLRDDVINALKIPPSEERVLKRPNGVKLIFEIDNNINEFEVEKQ